MAIIGELELEIDILEELEPYGLKKVKVRGSELVACSPFRHEERPSFSLNLETGLWVDRGCLDDRYKKGNIVKLLAYLEGTDYESMLQELLERYSELYIPTDDLQLTLNFKQEEKFEPLPYSLVQDIVGPTDYLSGRGISKEVQELFQTGGDPKKKYIALVWHTKNGEIANVKYRSTDRKKFYFADGGQPIQFNLFGLHQCIKAAAKEIWICEAEIDALTLWSHGIPAVATGSSAMSETQKDLLLHSGAARIVIATDNDAVGHAFRRTLIDEFLPHREVFDIQFPVGKKDINELSTHEIEQIEKTKKPVGLCFQL